MELLELEPPDYGVHASGIYVIDDNGTGILAGPFESEAMAIMWIDRRREMSNAGRRTCEPITT
jgi:hypothetical protein